MKASRQFQVFLLGAAAIVLFSVAWSMIEHRAHAAEREAWREILPRIEAGQRAIDSLEAVLGELDATVEARKSRLATDAARIAHWENRAVDGRLPTPAFRLYMATIDRHNATVAEHNEAVRAQQRVYASYSHRIETHNALVDSANDLQRRAVQEGFELPRVEE